MKEFINKLIRRFEEEPVLSINMGKDYLISGNAIPKERVLEIVTELAEEYNVSEMPTGWIPCDKELPPMPKENPLFENKPLELYLVSLNSTDYPWRAFWNGKFFTDGWSKVKVIAWMPLPVPFKEGE